ncbi:hypothetical protein [Macrococcus equipercicus]|uniref:Uncharacterized protein n=1 Tax=Macrococcus equipercicus TaxID=69967 RepID=A0A9Q9BP19_9STAP|nr:hypothetical protein [Macrococcus equipercicus]UTH12799.1 hypothetical protein KFV11_05795 [Macrococcus equipercicus]
MKSTIDDKERLSYKESKTNPLTDPLNNGAGNLLDTKSTGILLVIVLIGSLLGWLIVS